MKTFKSRRHATEVAELREQLSAGSLQIIVKWGASTMDVVELNPPAPYVVGTDAACCDFALPEEAEVDKEFELIHVSQGQVWLCVPPDAKATVRWSHLGKVFSEELLPRYGLLSEQSRMSEAQVRRVLLPMHGHAVVHLGGFSFFVDLGERARLPASAQVPFVERDVAGYFAASVGATLGLLGLAAFFVPPLGLTEGENIEEERVVLLRQYLESQAERERLEQPAHDTESAASEKSAEPAHGESGKLGRPLPQMQPGRLARKRSADRDTAAPTTRAEAIEEARTFGTISLLTGSAFASRTPTAFARDASMGEADQDLVGLMYGQAIGEIAGTGLGPSGSGDSGGPGHGIDMGNIGMDRNGTGLPWGPGQIGATGSRLLASHTTRVPSMHSTPPTVTGHLAPELIQRTVRQNYGRFRMCYERGLMRNPNLAGRVAVRFAIDSEGQVMHASVGESSLPDSEVVSCVVSAYYGLSFPSREHGLVTVVYPIAFSPE